MFAHPFRLVALLVLAPVTSAQSLELREPGLLYTLGDELLEAEHTHPVLLDDVDGDGAADFVLGGGVGEGIGAAAMISARSGSVLFHVGPGGDAWHRDAEVSRAGDVDADGLQDFLVLPDRPTTWFPSETTPPDYACIRSGRDGEILSREAWDWYARAPRVRAIEAGARRPSWRRELDGLAGGLYAADGTGTEVRQVVVEAENSQRKQLYVSIVRVEDELVLERRPWIQDLGEALWWSVVRDLDGDTVPDAAAVFALEHHDRRGQAIGTRELHLATLSTRTMEELVARPIWAPVRAGFAGAALLESSAEASDPWVAVLIGGADQDGEEVRGRLLVHDLATGAHLWTAAPLPGVEAGSGLSGPWPVGDLDGDLRAELAFRERRNVGTKDAESRLHVVSLNGEVYGPRR